MRRGQTKKVLPVGKLPLERLRSLLRHLPKHDPRLLIGPQIGEDAAVIDAGDRYLVVTTVSAALAAANVGEVVHAMHDPTEGGLAMGLFELGAPAGLGLRVIREHIPVFPETDTICSALALDPLKLIASGALLIAVAADRADSVLTAIEATGVPVVVIGEVRPSSEGITMVTNGAVEPLTSPVRDEIARAFEGG